MSGKVPIDFGENVPGDYGAAATGTTDATAYQLNKKVTIFTTVVVNGRALLPQSYASGASLKVRNLSANTLTLSPGTANQIEGYGIGVSVGLAPNGNLEITSFDPPASSPPRTWVLI